MTLSWKARLAAAALLLGGISFVPAALGHGGVIPPPPPPPPPPDPRGETIRRVNGATTGNPGAPGAPGRPAATGGIRGGGPATGRRATGDATDRWEYWWEANKDLYLQLRGGAQAVTQSTAFLGRAAEVPDARRVGADAVRSRVLPALLSALSEHEADVVDSAALALARIVAPEQAHLALAPLVRTLDHPQRSAREAAALALGVVGSTEALADLRALLLDEPRGRRLVGRSEGVEEPMRAFAAAALGLIGDPAAGPDLERAVAGDGARPDRSIAQLALLSLGMVRGRESETAAFLLATMKRRDLDPIVRAQAPIALAHLAAAPAGEAAARAALGALVGALQDPATEADLRRSAAVALGRLARVDDAEARSELEALVLRGSDGPARQFALIALAEIGARDAEARRHVDEQESLERFMLRQLVDPARASLKPFAALALGVWGRNEALMPDARRRAIAKLLEHLDSERSPSHQGALALALGLLDAREAIAPVARALAGTRDPGFKGHAALALGLLRARDHAAALRDELARTGLAPLYETQLAQALGLMGDPRAVPTLLDRLARADTFAEVAAVAQALGRIGDASAVDPLLSLLADANAPAARRGVAAVALGLLAQKGELPWNVPFRAGTNYCARAEALAEIADIL